MHIHIHIQKTLALPLSQRPTPRPANLEPLRTWKHPTLADTGVADPAPCPCCARVQNPAKLLDVSGFPIGNDYLCVACVARSWKHPTLADTGMKAEVRCRHCQRPTESDRMMDVRGFSFTPNARKRSVPMGQAYLCQLCVGELAVKDCFDSIEFHRAKGAPQYWLDWWEAKMLFRGLVAHWWGSLPQRVQGEILARKIDRALAAAGPKQSRSEPATPSVDV